jgi:hypothetical protein
MTQEERLHAGALQDESELMGTVRGIYVYLHESGASAGVLDKNPFGTIPGPDTDAIAGLQAESGETARDTRHLLIEFAP